MQGDVASCCPVCGYAELPTPPYDEHWCASFEVCPSCGTEFGYDDATKPVEQLRQEWLDWGAAWRSEQKRPPPGWSGRRQLEQSGLLNPKA